MLALHLAVGTRTPRAYLRRINATHDATEITVASHLRAFLTQYRTSLKGNLQSALHKPLLRVRKAQGGQSLQATVKAAVEEAVGADVIKQFPDLFNDLVDDLIANFGDTLNVTISLGAGSAIHAAVKDYLQNEAENYFSTFSDAQAQGIFRDISAAMESSQGYSVASVASKILENPVVYSGEQPISDDAWASMVARTETARATSYATQETLSALDLQTWQWNAEDSACDDCLDNDSEIVTVGDPFPSGDTEPPSHPNCRCVCLPVMDELASL